MRSQILTRLSFPEDTIDELQDAQPRAKKITFVDDLQGSNLTSLTV
jgi:hypothetical protein